MIPKILQFLTILLICVSVEAQIAGDLLLSLTNATTVEMNAISNPSTGALLYNTTESKVVQYNGSSWEKIDSTPTWTLSGNNQYSSVSGNVGIGTTSPSTKLDVNGGIRFRGQLFDVNNSTGTAGQMLSTTAAGIDWIDAPTGGSVWNNSDGSVATEASTTINYIGGNVGIGNNSPTATLDVSRGNATGGTAVFRGADRNSHFNYSTNEDTYIRGGKTNSNVYLNDNGGNVGIGTSSPTEKLDINGKLRVRNIPTGTNTDRILTTDANGNIRKTNSPVINKSYVQVYTNSKSFGSGNATLINLFPQVTIQAGKKVRIDIYVPTRSTTNNWGGLYVNINARVNGTWYNLGNTGYDGGAMAYSAQSIHALNHEMLLDFIANLSLPVDQSYTLQFELTARSYNGTTYVNRSHDINRTANNLGSRGALQTWASNQNYCHIIIEEKDR
ncbi:MAG: hypothetical protein V3U92_09820 [Cellulophaga sp.]